MSIFKDTFKQEIQGQLKARQEAIFERTPEAIQYFNARNSWIRMSSAVDVNGNNELAKKYILQGGTLYENQAQLRAGVLTQNAAYSILSPGGNPNRLGLRPMPGITGIDVKSLAAYGSLRQVEVKFIAWDIRQLEDLELLYMRPGYTALIEWGWAPYLNNNKKLQSNIDFTQNDIINKTPTKEQLFKNIYDTAVTTYSGNYDAMFGYVKNYSWSARDDGGYDCTTTIVSVGEVIESLKVNYAPFNALDTISKKGLISSRVEGINVSDLKDLKKIYSKNILAGLFYELHTIGMKKMPGTKDIGKNFTIVDQVRGNTVYYDLFKKTINIIGGDAASSSDGKVGASDEQIYITLESLCNIINSHVTFIDSNSKKSFVNCSVLDREYVTNNTASNPLTGDGYLLCLAHPLQLSVDPTVCIINNPVWANGFKVNPDTIIPDAATSANLITFPNSRLNNIQLDSVLDQLYYVSIPTKEIPNKQAVVDYLKRVTQSDPETIKALTKRHYEKLKDPNYKVTKPKYVDLINATEVEKNGNIDNTKLNKSLAALGVGSQVSLFNFLQTSRLTNLSNTQLAETFGNNAEFTKSDPVAAQQDALNKEKKAIEAVQKKAIKSLQYIKNTTRPYFYQNNWETELGIIGNIYVNLNFLYRLALDNNLESLDTKEKKDINLYNFLKSVLSEISSSTGNVNNFDLFVDPVDSKIYIIDINYVDSKSRSEVYEKAFTLEMHNTKSTVRSYKLESQIFPDQAATVAIGAQVGGGAMATDNNTMLDFNKGLEDRIIPKKIDPTVDPNQPDVEKILSQAQNVVDALTSLYEFFGDQEYSAFTDANFDTDKAADYKNSLKDLINFFKNLTKSNIKNRAIIPTKLSVTIDGIGGLVIGHIFKIPEELLPKGYKGGALGSKLGHIITGIGHSIGNTGDWTTNIDAQTIILDDPQGTRSFAELIEINPDGSLATISTEEIIKNSRSGGATKTINGAVRRNGEIEDLLVPIKPDLYFRHWSRVCQSDGKRIRLQAEAIKNLEALLTDAFNNKIYIKVNSAYRTREDQERIKADSVKTGIPAAAPGTSNHGFGLAVDLANASGVRINPTLTPKEWKWIQANKDKYGFDNLNNNNESHHYNFIK
jgi:LAS superfamily LD-carboxypeptidase LdcB